MNGPLHAFQSSILGCIAMLIPLSSELTDDRSGLILCVMTCFKFVAFATVFVSVSFAEGEGALGVFVVGVLETVISKFAACLFHFDFIQQQHTNSAK